MDYISNTLFLNHTYEHIRVAVRRLVFCFYNRCMDIQCRSTFCVFYCFGKGEFKNKQDTYNSRVSWDWTNNMFYITTIFAFNERVIWFIYI